ncbi:ccr4-not transcription complex [Culex quinquefasciatus]|uniref:Ccr4-not transcription complex n=1 Tax=Culex quinquefasciatus TaxID=7176 RepID=B0W846_CULQU|nr:ccr4-not transcription complex [Culex quinquefasciatus]|eukprot:XP_001844880.1 ccr4-not transcription complex [Culex quinquefasciatus]
MVNSMVLHVSIELQRDGRQRKLPLHILSVLLHGKLRELGHTDSTNAHFVRQLCRNFPRERMPVVLAPLLNPLVMEIGYTFTASLEDCKNHLLKVGGREISAQDVVKVISSITRRWVGGSKSEKRTWKPEIFVQALKEGVPSFNWNDGCLALDHQEFLIKDRPGLSLQLSIHFPVEIVNQRWTNVDLFITLIPIFLGNHSNSETIVPDVQPDGATADSKCFLQAGSNI